MAILPGRACVMAPSPLMDARSFQSFLLLPREIKAWCTCWSHVFLRTRFQELKLLNHVLPSELSYRPGSSQTSAVYHHPLNVYVAAGLFPHGRPWSGRPRRRAFLNLFLLRVLTCSYWSQEIPSDWMVITLQRPSLRYGNYRRKSSLLGTFVARPQPTT